jgi:hypothetical protein
MLTFAWEAMVRRRAASAAVFDR